MRTFLSLVILLFSSCLFGAIEYTVRIEGMLPVDVRYALEDSSTLWTHRSSIQTFLSLKRYIERDREEMVHRLHSLGYMEAEIQVQLVEEHSPIVVRFCPELKERYKLGTIGLYVQDLSQCVTAFPSMSDIPSCKIGSYVDGELFQTLEGELLDSLACRGYPHASLVDVIYDVDKATKQVHPFYKILLGPYTKFGPIALSGNHKISRAFILSKIPFHEGDPYNKALVEEATKTLLQTGLLTSASFQGPGNLDQSGKTPMKLNVQECKLHAIGGGVSYMTTLGPGISALYDHRYLGDRGQKLGLKLDLWQKKKQATATLTIPSWQKENQNLLWIVEYDEQTYMPYHSSAMKVSSLIEREFSKHVEAVYGARLEKLRSTHILSERHNDLFKLPLQLKLSSTDILLDPTKGATLNMRLTPTTQCVGNNFSYLINLTSATLYTSFFEDKATLAMKGMYGAIVGSKPKKIPLPDRFYGGSDTMLRGYKTGTISPRNRDGEFIGGNSLLGGSLEMRIRQQKRMGWVLFYDLGNSYKKRYPTGSLHFLHSVGGGVRYSTPLGPLRLDIGFPLNRRQGIDSIFQMYFSIGQAF